MHWPLYGAKNDIPHQENDGLLRACRSARAERGSAVARSGRRRPYYGGAYGYAGPYGNAGPYGYVSPYEGYAYVPGYRGRRAWDYPLGYDNTGRPYFRGYLGWRSCPSSGAPVNP